MNNHWLEQPNGARIHATAADVSSPPEKAMPTRSPTGREVRTLADMHPTLSVAVLRS